MNNIVMLILMVLISLPASNVQAQTLKAPDGNCSATLSIESLGGFRVLQLPDNREIRDVNGTVWLDGSTLIYSVSPIYGETPGVFAYRCSDKKLVTIKVAKNKNSAYPRGADYFEVLKIDGRQLIYFYYAADVDSIDFRTFRTERNLYQMRVDGRGFSKAPNSRGK